MAHKLVICHRSNIWNDLLLINDSLEVLEYLRHGISKPSFKTSLLVVATDENLIELDEHIFIILLIRRHCASEL